MSKALSTGGLALKDKMKQLLARKVEVNPHAQLLTPGEVQTAVTSMAQHPPAPSTPAVGALEPFFLHQNN
jgi:hypothetical protein